MINFKMCGIMSKEKLKKIIINLITFLLTIILFMLLNNSYLNNLYNLFEQIIIAFLCSYIIINTLLIDKTNKLIYYISYMALLIIILFFRKQYDNIKISNINYIYKWIVNIFKNKIIFINIIGNIILFIPMGILFEEINLRKIYKIIIITFLFTSIEIIQYILKIGVFDIYDILLYYIGFIIGVVYMRGGAYYEQRKKQKNKKREETKEDYQC